VTRWMGRSHRATVVAQEHGAAPAPRCHGLVTLLRRIDADGHRCRVYGWVTLDQGLAVDAVTSAASHARKQITRGWEEEPALERK
jgi:hypothetical protein